IALAADPGRAHRRKVWAAWTTATGRTGRWGALAALGVKLRAATTATAQPYPLPPDYIPCHDAGHIVRNWDPCDGPVPKGWRPASVGWIGQQREHDHLGIH
ncbi:MAG: hypothetical protein P4L86_21840, partial [Mycobacterium sp.]|nr:hypothetical protein [Mycobacterium sp.]